jgi:sulfopyruvate decarboxylase subunit alpha
MQNQPEEIISILRANGVSHVIFLPSSKLAPVIQVLLETPGMTPVPIGQEEEAFGISAGLSLAGKRSAIFIQDSGLGNSLIPLISLIAAYEFPLLVFLADETERDKDVAPKQLLSKKIIEVLRGLHTDGTVRVVEMKDANPAQLTSGRNVILL